MVVCKCPRYITWGLFGCGSRCLLLCPVLKHHLHMSLYFRHYCSSADPPPRRLQVDTSLLHPSLLPGWTLRWRHGRNSPGPGDIAQGAERWRRLGFYTGSWNSAPLSYTGTSPSPSPSGPSATTRRSVQSQQKPVWLRVSPGDVRPTVSQPGRGWSGGRWGCVCVCDHSWRKTRQRMNHNVNNSFLGVIFTLFVFFKF